MSEAVTETPRAQTRSARSRIIPLLSRYAPVVCLVLLIVIFAVLTDGRFLKPLNLFNVMRQISIEGLIAHVGPFEIALELQDRRWQEAGFSFSADVNGTGGGIEIEAQWCDQGRLLSRATTVAEGVETILQGPSQAISKSGGVTVLD